MRVKVDILVSYGGKPKPSKKLTFDYVGQPLTLNPPASPNLFKLSCFVAGIAWFKFRAPPCQNLNFFTRF